MSPLERNKRLKTSAETSMPTNDPSAVLTKIRRMLERQADTDSTALREISSRRRENRIRGQKRCSVAEELTSETSRKPKISSQVARDQLWAIRVF